MIIFYLLLFLFNDSYAQPTDSLRYKYTNHTITRYGSYFMKGSERLTFKDLSFELKGSELSMASFKLAKKNKSMSTVFRYLSLLSFLASTSFIKSDRNTSYILLGGAFLFTIGSGRYNSLYQQNLDRALWQYNKDVLFPSDLR